MHLVVQNNKDYIYKKKLNNKENYQKYIGINQLSYEEIKKIKFDISYLKMCNIWAENSHAKRKKVGGLLVKDQIIISDGFNGTPSGMDNKCEDENYQTHWYVLHAEANIIAKVCSSTQSSVNSTLYNTLSPCRDCSKLIYQVGIKRLVYLHDYRDDQGISFLINRGIEVCKYNPENLEIEI